MLTSQLRHKTLELHTPAQLNGIVTKTWHSQQAFETYLIRRHQVHQLLDTVVDVDTTLSTKLTDDLASLDLDWRHIPVHNTYAEYLQALLQAPGHRPALLAHYYGFVVAHLVGGGKHIGASASPVLPRWFLPQSSYYGPVSPHISGDILQHIDDEAAYWSREDDRMCLDELQIAFNFGMTILRQN